MRYWCSEGCGFVEPNHRCEQWSRLTWIHSDAEEALKAEERARIVAVLQDMPKNEAWWDETIWLIEQADAIKTIDAEGKG